FHVRPDERIEIGAQVARAFRAPRLEELFSDAPHLGAGAYEIGNPHLKDEVAHGIDVYAIARGPAYRVELAAFASQIADFIIYMPAGRIHEGSRLPVFVYEAADARLIGGEVAIDFRLMRNVSSQVVLDYVHGTRLSDSRTPLPFMPPLRGNFGLTYQAGSWRLGPTVRAVSRQGRVPTGEEPTAGYVLIGADVYYRLTANGVHSIGVRADNLTNRLYRDHLSRVEERDAPMPGRNLNLTYRWIF
ncbi:MAG: TonB-dependent receptor domain-containing protein, partial [Bacteroidota bacterium]